MNVVHHSQPSQQNLKNTWSNHIGPMLLFQEPINWTTPDFCGLHSLALKVEMPVCQERKSKTQNHVATYREETTCQSQCIHLEDTYRLF